MWDKRIRNPKLNLKTEIRTILYFKGVFQIKITKNHETPCEGNENIEKNPEKIETCYFCNKKFDINKDDSSHYKYGKYPMCDYCSRFYGFYD